MSDTQLTTDELNKLFQDLTILLLGLGTPSGADDPLYQKVRISWPTEGQPAWDVADDVVFLRCFEIDDPYNRQRHAKITAIDGDSQNLNQATTYTRVINVTWIVYGPSSHENVNAIRDHILDQLNLDVLALNNLHILPFMKAPVRVPELYNGLWYEREDFSIMFNEKTVINLVIPAITSAEITLSDNSGTTSIVEVVANP